MMTMTLHRFRRALAALALAAWCSAASAEAQSLEAIRAAVQRYVETEFSGIGTISSVEVSPLDSRLRLAPCEQPLQPFTPSGQRRAGHATVGVRCDGVRPWTLYVPVKIVSTAHVITAARALPRGAILSPQDLVPVQRDVAALPYGYFIDSERLLGQQLKRAVRPGDILSPAMVAPAPAVERGQTVWIAAEVGGIKVTMKGEALADGAIGERVPVRNVSSKRVLEAEVVSAHLVRVAL